MEKIVGIEIFSTQRDEQFTGLDRARIGADALDDGVGIAALNFRGGELCDLLKRKRFHLSKMRLHNSG
jgi:hypothetical protein